MAKSCVVLLATLTVALAATGCSKQKTCRCSVMGRMEVRIVKIDKGSCEAIKTYHYHDALDSLKMDSLLCTDYEFMIDSIYRESEK